MARQAPESQNRSPVLPWLTVLTSVLAGITGLVSSFSSLSHRFGSGALLVTASAVGIMATVVAVRALILARAQPRTVTVSLLGFPNAGKTVFLSVLYHELATRSELPVHFMPYGSETTERVNEAVRRLRQGNWLPRTQTSEVFFHRSRASVGTGWLARRYKIEVPDYAGELIQELDASTWLHKSEYFRYVVDSDAVFLCIDCALIASRNREAITDCESAMLAAVQLLFEEKVASPERRSKTPIALLFLKADLVDGAKLEELLGCFPSLNAFLRRHYVRYETFAIAAVVATPDGKPDLVGPMRVVDPMLWVLRIL